MSSRWSLYLGCLAAGLIFGNRAVAQTQIKGRVMVMVDTSGSMTWHFNDNLTTGGDGDASSRFTDATVAGQSFYPGLLVNGKADGINSRLYAAKTALRSVISSTGDLDFGLMRYAVNPQCPNNVNCCNFVDNGVMGLGKTFGACICTDPPKGAFGGYSDNPAVNPAVDCYGGGGVVGDGRITWGGSCGPKDGNGNASDGGQVLVQPTQNAGNAAVLQWVDGVEDFRAGGLNGFPANPELRGNGETPLAGVVRSAINKWYTPIYTASKGGNCNPQNDPLCDPQINCRPYIFVVMTDGADSCEGKPSTCKRGDAGCTCFVQAGQDVCYTAGQINNPPSVVKQLTAVNQTNPVQTYVIGLAFVDQNDPAIGVLNQMAANGGTSKARFANNLSDIEGAFADIASASVKYEICNGQDDNCDGQIDEGFDKGSKCAVGVGGCLRNGIKKCAQDGSGTVCCVDDGKPDGACQVLQPGMAGQLVCQNGVDNNCNGAPDLGEQGCMMGPGCVPSPEICDGKDNDCDGVVDDNLVDTGKACGLAVGICTPGMTVCSADMGKAFPDASDHLACTGGAGPQKEICDGLDNDCDGIVDGITQLCYGGANGTDNVGLCHDGQQKCSLGMWGTCVGQLTPQKEVCNGLDDDCDGKIDDVAGAGAPCCPSMKCGTGVCTAGTMQCSGGSLQCVGGQSPGPELCNGLDDDCDGMVDDLPNLGKPCVSGGGCAGKLACDLQQKQVTCQASGQRNPEVCDGMDNDCDGVADEPADVAKSDPRIGQDCGNPKNLPLPCRGGKTGCKKGQVICDGAVTPGLEVCDGVDNDCDGVVDNNAACPANYLCYQSLCDPLCAVNTEFACGGGFTETSVNGQCVCVPDRECSPACAAPLVCDPTVGKCVDRCATVKCPDGLQCDHASGTCQGCERFGCAKDCTRCDKSSHACVDDKCCHANCDAGKFCDPTSGICKAICRPACATGQVCMDGVCVGNPCYQKQCPEGKACDTGSGECVGDPCTLVSCSLNLACCSGACVADPCGATLCPDNSACKLNPLSCEPSCEPLPLPEKDQVIGAGGGLSCSLRGGAGSANRAKREGIGYAGILMMCALRLAAGRRRARRQHRDHGESSRCG